MSFGDVPEFVKRGALREPKLYTDSNTCLGAGEELLGKSYGSNNGRSRENVV